jgi:hypothetical protein
MNARTTAIAAFKAAIAPLGGAIKNQNDTPQRAYCRAVLPVTEEVRPKDLLKPGVAIRASGLAIYVIPYVFREICGNGAIWAHSSAALSLNIPADATAATIEDFVHTSTKLAASEETIAACFEEVRTGIRTKVDVAQLIVSAPSKGILDYDLHLAVNRELARQPEARTRYDAMNVVTAVARDIRDPETKWKLESFATTLLIGATKRSPQSDSSLAASHCV